MKYIWSSITSGLRSPWCFYQYISEVENTLPRAKLEGHVAEFLVRKLNSLKSGVDLKILPYGIRAYGEFRFHNKKLLQESKEICAQAFRLLA